MQTANTPQYIEMQTFSSPIQVTRKPLPSFITTSTPHSLSKKSHETNPFLQTSTIDTTMNITKSKSLRLPQVTSSLTPPQATLKKSKSVRVKSALKAVANPVKTRKDKKATKSELEMKEREEAARNVDDFLTSGRLVSL